jgi:hypothetical protein
MQPGAPGPGQDPYQQYPPGYGQVPQYSDPFGQPSGPPYDANTAGGPYPPDPFAAPSSPFQPPQEYSLYTGPQPPPPPVPQYPVAGYSVPPMPPPMPMGTNQNNTFGLLSMIFGIVALPMLCCFYTGAAIGVAAAALGVIGLQKANRGEASNKGMAVAGIVCGSIAGFLGLLWIIAVAAFNFAAPTYN